MHEKDFWRPMKSLQGKK